MRGKRGGTSRSQTGGPEEEIRFVVGRSSLGSILVGTSNRGVVSISIGKDRDELLEELQDRFPKAHLVPGDREDRNLVKSVVDHVETPSRDLDLLLDIRGTAFQRRVWQVVQGIPVGQTSTYSEVARQIGAPKAMRAVGNACSTNRLSFAVPCHRVLRSDGSAAGDRQRWLIEREAEAVQRL